jgi:AAA domain
VNFQGLASFVATLRAPVNIVAGPNASGKSTVRDAIELALTGRPRRVSLKKDFAKLVYDQAKSGKVALHFAGGGFCGFTVPAGDWVNTGGHDLDPAELAIALDAELFAGLDPEKRRAFLFRAMQIPTKPAQVKARLLDMGLDAARLDQVSPMLAGGFAPAEKEAASMARDAKAAWRAVTGEQWGSQKAEAWQPPGAHWGEADEVDLATREQAVDAARRAVEDRAGALAKHAAAVTAYEDAARRRNALKARADKVTEAGENSERAQRDLYEQREKVAAMRAASAAPRLFDCPACGALLTIDGPTDSVVEVERTANVVEPPAGDLAEHEAAERMLANALANRQRFYADAAAAVAELSAFKMPEPPGEPPAPPDALRQAVKVAEEVRDELREHKRLAAARAQKAKDATRHHVDVKAWLAIAEALSPDGLPAILLAEALEPLNSRIAWAATMAKWRTPSVSADMAVQVDGRDYALLSESEKWRVDACFAVSFAAAMGTGIVMLDRWDVLDVPSRGEALAMLRAVRGPFNIEAAFLFGTLKAKPEKLPSGVEMHWLPALVRAQPTREMAQQPA